jgi:dipeptidyl aminopeptidase/acylaminoacyl peptidase
VRSMKEIFEELRKAFVLFACTVMCLAVTVGVAAKGAARPADDQQSKTDTLKKNQWTPEDVVYQEDAGQFRISPDERFALWVKGTGDKEKDLRVGTLYLSNLGDGKSVQLTRGTDEISNPRWSPSGEWIGFLSNHPLPKPKPELASTQLWLMSAQGGEPWAVSESTRDIQQFEWLDDKTILFSAEEEPSLYEQQTKERKDDSNVVDDTAHAAPVRLFKLSIADKKITRVTDNDDWILGFQVSHDKTKAVAVARKELSFAWDQKIPPATYIVNLASGERTQIFTNERIQPDEIEWARDDSGFYVAAPYSSDAHFLTATVMRIYFYDLSAGKTVEVNLDWDRGFERSVQATSDGFIALLADGVYTKAARYTRHGSTWSRKSITSEDDRHYFSFELGDDGKTLIYEYSTSSVPTQFFRARLEGTKITSAAQITDLNPGFKTKTIARSEILHWTGANDDEVEGILFYPDNYKAGESYPLVVTTHGGPASADHDQWSERWGYAPNLLAQRGAFVLKTNYHGSTGYGLKWVESICCGKYYELEVPDIERGVDNLITRGLVDPDKIGAQGWSNGSILSIQLTITNPERYKAASVGAGDVEWISDWANVDFGEAWDHYYFGKTPLEDPQLYIEKSPLFKMDRVKTPTIIFFGTIDRQVPTEEGWTHYRALYTIGKAPVKFILFPGEAHGPKKLSHQLRKLNEEDAWFDLYLFKTNKPENEALKKGSPLEVALKRRAVQKSGAVYGVAFRLPSIPENPAPDVMVPETVKRNINNAGAGASSIEIGRFEVTRAQYAAFDKEYQIAAGTENYPANGISFEQAKAYCKWLSELTGETYRLPNEGEVKDLYKPSSGENTLDYWAGYSLNPEDAVKLEDKIKELPGDAPLLREVGSFAAEGGDDEEPVFDFGGNVAEWVIAADGAGKTLGGSADRPGDSRAPNAPADAAYTGFRVLHVETQSEAGPQPAERPKAQPKPQPKRRAKPAIHAEPAPE